MALDLRIIGEPAGGELLYRLVRDPRGRLEDFRSQRERRPRRPIPIGSPWLFVVGVSMFDSLEGALAVARLRPAWVAEIELRSGRGIHLAQTGTRGHHTVWGDPRELANCIRDWHRAP